MVWLALVWKVPLVWCLLSFGEWLVHRWLLHGEWVYDHVPFAKWMFWNHHIEHHGAEFNDRRPHIDLVLVDYAWVLPFTAVATYRWIWIGDVGGLTSLIAQATCFTAHLVLWNKTHRAIHGLEPGNWATRLPWYAFIRDHHLQHHVDPRTNLNIVFPLADFVFRTRRRYAGGA